MSIEELEAENLKLMGKKDEIRLKQREINDLMTKKIAEAEAKRKFDSMSDAEKSALAQIVSNAGGIESKEKVGAPK